VDLQQIDIVKALAIIGVITTHSVLLSFILAADMQFYAWQAMPLFVICTGLLWYLSFYKNGTNLKQMYSFKYFKSKFSRFVLPFAVLFALDLAILYSTGAVNLRNVLSRLQYMQPPISGAGDYYLAFILELIFVAPLIFYCFHKKPLATVATLFLLDLAFELMGPYMDETTYYFGVIRMFSAFALGLVLARNIVENSGWKLRTKSNVALIALGFCSAVFLFFNAGKPTPMFRPEWLTMNLYSFFYPTVLVMAALSLGPFFRQYAQRFWVKVAVIGKASYHIFLVQILFFSPVLAGLKLDFGWEGWNIPFNLSVTLAFGLVFYFVDLRMRRAYANMKKGKS